MELWVRLGLGLWAAGAVWMDVRRRRLPNVLTLGAAAVGLGWLVVRGASPGGAAVDDALWGAGLALVLTLPPWLRGAMGAGDVKLALAIGLMVGTIPFVAAYLVGSILAGVWAAVQLCMRRTAAPSREGGSGRTVPFGAALAVGLLAVLLWPGSLAWGV